MNDSVRYRSREYDTNRDPRGPLSACVEVLYGVITDMVGAMVRTPGQLFVIPGNEPLKKSDRIHVCE